MPRLNNYIIAVFTCVLAASCVRPEEVKTADIDPTGWYVGDGVKFEFENTDTLSRRNISFLLRFDDTFRVRNIPVTVKVTTPDSLWYEESFTAVPKTPVRVNKDFHEAAAPYRYNVMLSHKGRYIFEITNTEGEIHGIWGMGLIIE